MPADHIPQLLAKIETYEGELNTRLGLKMLVLTFVRTNELIGAEWTEFDIEDAMWTIPGARMKKVRGKAKVHVDCCDHLVPLARQTIAILQELRGLNGESRYLFAGRNARTCMSNNTLLFALYRMGYRRRMSGHGFRAIASTILNEESSFTSDVIERQLAHQERNSTRAAYNRAEHVRQRREMMQWYADFLDQLRKEGAMRDLSDTITEKNARVNLHSTFALNAAAT